jgi:large conductance mechanosensitive channel
MKKFFGEFKKFITRGNIVDMAVGVIVGSSFTAIVNALSNNILKPIINHILRLILGKDALSEVYTFLGEKVYILDVAGLPTSEIDLKNSIYIDWGAFIIAIINFLIVAFVLFCIVKTVNSMRENSENLEARMKKFTKEDRKIMKARGIRPTKKTIEEYIAEKEAAEAKAKADAEAEAKAKAAADRLANPTTEDLLKSILEEMKKNK